jgi:hypothetical protein
MKVFVASLCLVAVTLAKDDHLGFLVPTEEMIQDMVDTFGAKVMERMQPKKSVNKGMSHFGPAPKQVPYCDQELFMIAGRDFEVKMGLPKIVLGYKLLQAIKALVVADGYNGVSTLAGYVREYYTQLGSNVACFHPANLRALGLPFKAILPTILQAVQLATDAYNFDLIDQAGYSCAVKTALDTMAEELALLKAAVTAAYIQGADTCELVRVYLFGISALFGGMCGENVAKYTYAHEAAPLKVLFPQCNIPDITTNQKILSQFHF